MCTYIYDFTNVSLQFGCRVHEPLYAVAAPRGITPVANAPCGLSVYQLVSGTTAKNFAANQP